MNLILYNPHNVKLRLRTQSFFIFLVVSFLQLISCKEEPRLSQPLPPEIISISPMSGIVGDEIIIDGNNFSSIATENEVRLNDVLATVTNATSHQLTITVPAGAMSGKIIIKVDGLTTTSSDDFKVWKDIPRPGLVLYFPFNGNANDESDNKINGTVNGPSLTVDRFGNENKAYAFDGVDDFIFIGNPPALQINQAITISAWIKIQGTPFSVYLLSKIGVNVNGSYEGYDFLTYKNGLVNQYSHGLILSGPTTGLIYAEGSWLPEEWVYTTVSLEDDHCKLYVNGEKILDKTGAKSLHDIDPTIGNFIIGKSSVAGLENPFQGSIDELTIYNRALSEQEVLDLYEATKEH